MKRGRPIKAIYRNCVRCGKKFYCIFSRIKTHKYCSNKCWHAVHIGKDHPNWKGGTYNGAGYKMISVMGRPTREHRLVMEKFLGRKLEKNEVVHHINGIRDDNRIENLKIMIRNVHDKEHTIKELNPFFGKKHSSKSKRIMREKALKRKKVRDSKGRFIKS